MLRWRELHPYSAAHAVWVAQPLDQARLHRLINRRLEALGLAGLVLEPERGSVRGVSGAAGVELGVLAESADSLAALWSEIERQLNRPFPRAGSINAFRFFVATAGDGFYLALVYDHFIAAGDAIALFLKRLLDDYSDPEAMVRPEPPSRVAPPGYRGLLFRHPLSVAWAMLRLPSLVARSRRAVRPPASGDGDAYNALTYLRVEPPAVEGLRDAVAAWGVTLNDLLLACLLQALAPLAPERSRAARRRELAVASIVNIREDLPQDAERVLGPFLASFQVSHPVPPGISLRELARDVHAASARIRRERLYLQAVVALGLSALMWPFLSPARRLRFFPKYHPVWGGISMLNVNALWARSGNPHAPPMVYLRAASTGPACPLVLAVTVVRDTLHIGISFRTGVFSRATVGTVKAALARAIGSLREEACR
jgi:hypothetical protein